MYMSKTVVRDKGIPLKKKLIAAWNHILLCFMWNYILFRVHGTIYIMFYESPSISLYKSV